MFILFSIIVIAAVAILIYRTVKNGNTNGGITLDENKIVKRFNKLVRSISERNINTVKEELNECLDEYKTVKVNQFIESKNELSSSIRLIREEIENSTLTQNSVKKQIVELKKSENPDVATGAALTYQFDKIGEMIVRMNEIKDSLDDKDKALDREIDSFNAKYAMKKSEISMMIAQAISLKNISNIDIKLNDLVTEFKNKSEEIENANYVKSKVYKVESDFDDNNIDYDKYKEKFLSFGNVD